MVLYRTGDGKMYPISEDGTVSVNGKKYRAELFVPGNVGVSNRDGTVYFGGATPYDSKTGKVNPKLSSKGEKRSKILLQSLKEDGMVKKSNRLEDVIVTKQIIDVRK